ncbi:GGDEF domain-containing protein [Vibrio ziniensis]|uniref:diguanylate cyclase n=1 Tax=Vibrio ziniensis TaxID=2711221 RepID=A0A6G7CKT6_9VIBR|nr:diguanylate cyclase [Vibrio ziniensis]QIH42737.1 diguanylate cyclase [Vibrio ziniensis]
MLNKRYFSANSVISAVTWLIITVMMLITALIMYFLHVLDDKTIQDVHRRVDIAFTLEKENLYNLNIEYSYWDEGYERSIAKPDKDWFQSTYQDYMIEHYHLSYIALIKKAEEVEIIARSDGEPNNFDPQLLLSSSILERVMRSKNKKLLITRSAFFSEFNGRYFLVSAEPFRDESTGNIVDSSFLVLAKELNSQYLTMLSQKYKLPSLSISKGSQHNDTMVLSGASPESVLTHVYWNAQKLSDEVFPYALAILFAFMSVTVVLARLLLSKDFRDRDLYQEELFVAATTDSLTSVSNRRHFIALGKRELQLHTRKQTPLSLLTFDLDYFKAINDSYGHAVGDEALKHFTNLCKNFFRDTDIFGRLGGEEFGLILPGVRLDKALQLANKLRVSLSETPLLIDDVVINLTVSVGVVTLSDQSSIDELLADADKALYVAKNSGRNVVKFSE